MIIILSGRNEIFFSEIRYFLIDISFVRVILYWLYRQSHNLDGDPGAHTLNFFRSKTFYL